MSTLKPITALEREFASLLGETAEEWQRSKLVVIQKKSGKPKQSKESLAREINRALRIGENKKVLNASNLDSTSEVARKMEEREKLLTVNKIQWIPEAYVLIAENTDCLRCYETSTKSYQIFLRHIPLKEDSTHAKHYVPVDFIKYKTLPRIVETKLTQAYVCAHCLQLSEELCQIKRRDWSSFGQEHILSSVYEAMSDSDGSSPISIYAGRQQLNEECIVSQILDSSYLITPSLHFDIQPSLEERSSLQALSGTLHQTQKLETGEGEKEKNHE